jgi:hypothetical protein
MQHLIKDIYEKLSPVNFLDVIETDERAGSKEYTPEHVTVVYSDNICNGKGYHFYEFEDERVKHNPEFFKIELANAFALDSIPMALVKGTVVYLLFEVSDKSQKFLETVLRSLLPSLIERAEEKRKHNFKVALSKAIDDKLTEYKSDIAKNETDADDKEQDLLEIRRKIAADKCAAQALDGTVGQWKQKAEQEYEHLMKLVPNLYNSICVEDGVLIARTHFIDIRHNNFLYEIGEFEVRIVLATGELVISNQTNKVHGYDHPHIDSGAACLGNIGRGIIRMLAEFELFGALQVIHTFLNSYNSESPYKKIEYWDPDFEGDEDDRYENCHEDNTGYACVECGDHNCPFYDQAFEVCFENSSLQDCIECEYQCRLGRQRIKEHEEKQQSIEKGVEA